MNITKKKCKYCGGIMDVKKGESPSEYIRRTYCDKTCMRKAFLKFETEKTWSNAHISARRVADLYLDTESCEICGKTGRLDIHHKDCNEQNNNPNNLQVLCRSCHMKLHHPKHICKVDGCNRNVKGYGFCEKHYQRYKKYGDPLLTNRGHGNIVRVES